jgi:DNA repair protein RAD7
MEYMIEKIENMRWLHLYAANLINNETWSKFFLERGATLECLQLSDLDTFFEDEQIQNLVDHCPNLSRLKLKRCRRLTTDCLSTVSQLKNLRHFSIQFSTGVSTPNDILTKVLTTRGRNLQTIS